MLRGAASRVGPLSLRLREGAHLKCYKWAGAKLKWGGGVGKRYYTGRTSRSGRSSSSDPPVGLSLSGASGRSPESDSSGCGGRTPSPSPLGLSTEPLPSLLASSLFK